MHQKIKMPPIIYPENNEIVSFLIFFKKISSFLQHFSRQGDYLIVSSNNASRNILQKSGIHLDISLQVLHRMHKMTSESKCG